MSAATTTAPARVRVTGRRLLLLTPSLDYGGAEIMISELALAMREFGWSVQLVSMLEPRAFSAELRAQGVDVVSLGMRSGSLNFAGILRLFRLLLASKPTLVHAHMFHANVLARVFCTLLRIPSICTVHSTVEAAMDSDTASMRDRLYKLTDRLATRNTAVSERARARHVRDGAAVAHRMQTIPNGVNTSHFRSMPDARIALRRDYEWDQSFVWMAVGRLELAKDYPTLLRAFKTVQQQDPGSRLAIVGEGRLRKQLEALAAELELTGCVEFLGLQRHIPRLLNAADGLVLSSMFEGGPLVLLEAGATGLPVVSTKVGEAERIVLEGETGLLVEAKDSTALAAAMMNLRSRTADERSRMGQRARTHIENHYSANRCHHAYANLYARILEQTS